MPKCRVFCSLAVPCIAFNKTILRSFNIIYERKVLSEDNSKLTCTHIKDINIAIGMSYGLGDKLPERQSVWVVE